MSIDSVGASKSFGQTEISQLQHSVTVQQQIIGLQILKTQQKRRIHARGSREEEKMQVCMFT